MGAGHSHPLYRDGNSVVHRAPAEVKIVALVVFVLAVVATPREMIWPFAVYAVIVLVVWRVARIPLRWILPRMLIEAPFIVLAVLLPFAEGGAAGRGRGPAPVGDRAVGGLGDRRQGHARRGRRR